MTQEQLERTIAEVRAVSEARAEEYNRRVAERDALLKHENTVQLILGCVNPGAREAVETCLRDMMLELLEDGKHL